MSNNKLSGFGNPIFETVGGDISAALIQLFETVSISTQEMAMHSLYGVKPGEKIGSLPTDVILNGGIYMAGTTPLPEGLSSVGGIIMTDGSVFYPNTIDRGGVLCAAS